MLKQLKMPVGKCLSRLYKLYPMRGVHQRGIPKSLRLHMRESLATGEIGRVSAAIGLPGSQQLASASTWESPLHCTSLRAARGSLLPATAKLSEWGSLGPGMMREFCSHPFVELSEREYEEKAEDILHSLLDKLEAFGEDMGIPDFDANYSDGVLTVSLGSHGTFVINKQRPNRQIWLSSPISGPSRMDYTSTGQWVYKRTGAELSNLLEKEISQLTGHSLQLAQ